MLSKPEIFNLALSQLYLTKEITDAESDPSKEARTLRLRWPQAWAKVLEDLDLNATVSKHTLELHSIDPNPLWGYAYKRPPKCAFFRRIENCSRIDNEDTKIPHETGILNGIPVIFTDECKAIGQFISTDVPLGALNPSACLALASMLAWLSPNLIVGKGAQKIRAEIMENYRIFKSEAQEHDARENERFFNPYEESSFVRERIS